MSGSVILNLVMVVFSVALIFETVNGQLYASRSCTANATLAASRCSYSISSAVYACSTYCANTAQNGTSLYSYFCNSTSLSCGTTSYCYIAPSPINCTVPQLTNAGSSVVVVPCNASYTPVTGVQLNFSTSCGQSYYVNQQVISSTTSDSNTGYLIVLKNGTIIRGPNGPTANTVQTIAFTLVTISALGTYVYSNTVTVTFQFQSCALQISCPSSIVYCPENAGFPYPQLTCQVTNAPAGTQIVWDQPGNYGATAAQLAAIPCPGCNSPAVINSTNNDNTIYISNLNSAQMLSSSSTVGVYGGSSTPLVPQPGSCQYLRISAVTTFASNYSPGIAFVQVCVDPNTACTGAV